MPKSPIYFGSIVLEPNRWKAGKEPSYKLSEWLPRIRSAGFDGVELWENHYRKANPNEQKALADATDYLPIFNTYTGFTPADSERRERETVAQAIRLLKCRACKFNVGGEVGEWDSYLRTASDWAKSLPADCNPLCECHPGTVLETPEGAGKAFAVWDSRFQAIVHPFAVPPDTLREWFRQLGGRIRHVHVQLRDEKGVFLRLDRRPRLVKEALTILRDNGFAGSFTLEFTEGTRTPHDTPEMLWENAEADLAFLREHWHG
jgi:sugar phosphate isomerase/epimerase